MPRPPTALGGWLALDALGACCSWRSRALLFLAAAVYAVGYLARERPRRAADVEEGFLFANAPEAVFTGCLLLFLAAMTLVLGEPAPRPAVGRRSRRPRWPARR